MKLNVSGSGNVERLPAGVHLVEVFRVYVTDKEDEPLIGKDGEPYFSVILRCVQGKHAGKTYWNNFMTSGPSAGRTVKLLKATGVIPMDATVEDMDFDPMDLKSCRLGVELERSKKNEKYLNITNMMTVKQFKKFIEDEEDIPF